MPIITHGGFNSQIVSSPDESEIQAGRWIPIVPPFDSDGINMIKTGAPDVAALDSFKLQIRDKIEGPLTVWLGGVSAVTEPSQPHSRLSSIMGGFGIYACYANFGQVWFPSSRCSQIPETANDPAFMTTQQVQYLQNTLGWDIACHTWDHIYQLGLASTDNVNHGQRIHAVQKLARAKWVG